MEFYWILIILVSFLLSCSSEKPKKFTPTEIRAINKLSDSVSRRLNVDYMKSDSYIYKWLKAKNFNHAEATEALEKALEWRKQERIDNLPFEDMGDVKKRYIIDFTTSRDKQGRPVLLLPYGDWDVRRMALAGKIDKLTRVMDNAEEQSAQLAFNLTGQPSSMILVDLNGYNLRKHACISCLPLYVDWVKHHELYYPYNWYRMFGINVPSIFNPVLSIMRGLMSPPTREAFKTFGHDKAEWQAVIAETVDLSELPIRFGGTKKGNAVASAT